MGWEGLSDGWSTSSIGESSTSTLSTSNQTTTHLEGFAVVKQILKVLGGRGFIHRKGDTGGGTH
jgi:hypothetical protein